VAASSDGPSISTRPSDPRRTLGWLAVALFIAGPFVFSVVGGLTRGGGDVVDVTPAWAACGLTWLIALVALLARFALEPPFRGEML